MNQTNHRVIQGMNINQIRLESCIGTIMTIKDSIKNLRNIDPVFLFQFNKLEVIIPQIKSGGVTSNEVEKIEKATNNLFEQMKYLFDDQLGSEVYKGLKH